MTGAVLRRRADPPVTASAVTSAATSGSGKPLARSACCHWNWSTHISITSTPALPARAGDGDLVSSPRSTFTDTRVIETHVPNLISATEDEAKRFGCNAVVVGKTVVLNAGCPRLAAALKERDFTIVDTPLDEFLKAGGYG